VQRRDLLLLLSIRSGGSRQIEWTERNSKQQTNSFKLDDLARKINRGAPLTMTILWEFNEKHPKQVARGCSPWVFEATAQALYDATPLLMPTSATCK
jgi:hypothetical protein